MARLPRLCVPGWPHLLMQQGHDRQPVFRDAQDRAGFRTLLQEAARTHGLAVHAYALLHDEYRLLATPAHIHSLSHAMQSIGRRYGSAFNRRHGHTGSVWGGRFKATVIDPARYLLDGMRYVEEAAQDAGAQNSSLAHHQGAVVDPLVVDHSQYWALGNTPFEREAAYRQLLAQPLPALRRGELDAAVRGGWPLGDAAFMAKLAQSTDRRLQPLPRGRPKISI